jgi:phytoene dehydrogenase-like protein
MSRESAPPYDCIVVGAGHNGLVCAAYLARAGRSVLVLEAGEQVGGAAVTREFAPGFRVSAGAHFLNQFSGTIARELALEREGLRYCASHLPTIALSADASPLTIDAAGVRGLPEQHASDGGAFLALRARLARFARALLPVLGEVPPRLHPDRWSDRLALLKVGLRIRVLGRREMRELLRIGGMNSYDLFVEHFASAALQGALGLDAVLGSNAGPRTPGTVLTLLYRLATQAGGTQGTALPQGGLGALSDALAASARTAGATVRAGARVARILVRDDCAAGVALASGEEIAARAVISSADPQTTFLTLLGAEHLDAGFVRKVRHLRTRGLAAKLHLALDRLPAFRGLTALESGARLIYAPSLTYLEHAFNHSKYGEHSAAPALEISLPSVHDQSLAPPGRHVLSAIVQYAPYALKEGWPAARAGFAARVLATLETLAPGLSSTVVGQELLTPVDLEREFRMSGGHWHHADLAFDQFYMVRPVPGATQHSTPLAGLYLCGAGCHPGGGVMGTAGRNAARQVLREAA